MKIITVLIKHTTIFMLLSGVVLADQKITSIKVDKAPKVDGIANDLEWSKAKEITTFDRISKSTIHLKSVYTKDEIFFLVKFKKNKAHRSHKDLVWDKKRKLYKVDTNREDTFVFKWNMEPYTVDLTLKSTDEYMADIWYWKAFRSDHAGRADDKIQSYSSSLTPKSHQLIAKNGNTYYLTRKGDKGRSSYKNEIPTDYVKDTINSYKLRKPLGSRADVRAKGHWDKGMWTLEFSRKLNTNNSDDIRLQPGLTYQFGVSRYEIAGRLPNPNIDIPLYGSGDISENINLIFN